MKSEWFPGFLLLLARIEHFVLGISLFESLMSQMAPEYILSCSWTTLCAALFFLFLCICFNNHITMPQLAAGYIVGCGLFGEFRVLYSLILIPDISTSCGFSWHSFVCLELYMCGSFVTMYEPSLSYGIWRNLNKLM